MNNFKRYIGIPKIIISKEINATILESYMEVQNPFGVEKGEAGDYLIKDEDEIMYIMKKEKFEKEYVLTVNSFC